MSISNQDEYKLPSGETISIQLNNDNNIWEVDCWDKNDECRWYRRYKNKEDALKEYNKWKINK